MKKADAIKAVSDLLLYGESISIKALADNIGVSLRSMYTYLAQLEDSARAYNVALDRSHSGFVRMIGAKQNLTKLSSHLAEQVELSNNLDLRRDQIIERLLLKDEVVSLNSLAEELHVSRSSLVNDFNVVEKKLEELKLHLIRDRRGTRIGGKEQDIRDAKSSLLRIREIASRDGNKRSCQEVLEPYFGPEVLMKAIWLASCYNVRLDRDGSSLDMDALLTSCAVFLDRIKHGHVITVTHIRPAILGLHETSVWPITLNMCEYLYQQGYPEISIHDARWLNARISSVYREVSTRKEEEQARSAHLDAVITDLVQATANLSDYPVALDERLFDDLKRHLVPLVVRIANNNQESNPFTAEITKTYSETLAAVQKVLENHEADFGGIAKVGEACYVTTIIESSRERQRLDRKVYLLIDKAGSLASLTETSVKRILGTRLAGVYDLSEYKQLALEANDAVVSTKPLEGLDTLVISPFVNERDSKALSLL